MMLLPPPLRLKLHQAMVESFQDVGQLQLLAANRLGTPLAAIAADGPTPDVVHALITWAETNGNLSQLVEGAVAERPNVALLAAVAAMVKQYVASLQPPYVPVNPFQCCLPKRNMPFVNRGVLRGYLQSMLQPDGAAVLAVEGPTKCGKSYTAHLIAYLAGAMRQSNAPPPYLIAMVDLANEYAGFDAGDLTEAFARSLGRSQQLPSMPTRVATEAPARWVVRLANWLVGEIRQVVQSGAAGQVWLIVDGFRCVAVDTTVTDVLRRLADAAFKTVPELRLVLLDFADALPPVEQFVARERLAVVTRADLSAFYANLIAGTGRTIDNETLASLTDATWQDAGEETAAGFMERLAGAIARDRLPTLLGER